ncbi:MAG TPA: heme ABC transporter ATP-binding protein [Gemmatimonas aurantiaca]|uniref:Heme ABC transporter ATP-binding protein n=2 Tax=Gemmatimonas aurantiaca TaxID=173480 RepID=A0A3D4VDU9_9BACT|nr:ATP-binding cassette domain-containing protein [Gemmatimonas aurantiaca]BAH37066.1 putative ABC transporter ATP-binding protein [Gemmatimonas aurantiaca T-27]HCT58902.1 heme ABC transporter ATP-binding protein [Gemmatimonas aurantiaca]
MMGRGETAQSETTLLSLERLSRRFGDVQALDDASLRVRAGTVHALLGENGAGKTTLMRLVFGLLTPDGGTMLWRGASLRVRSPAHALSMGIGMVHQHFTLVPAMTVAENVALGGHGRFDREAAAARVREVGARAGLSLDPSARVDSLPVGAQQRCEIVKALARDVQLLILDEPTAVLAPSEARELLAWVRRFADAGNAVVLITHKLRDALAVADDVTVLHRGRSVLTMRAADTTEAHLANAMLGERTIAAPGDVDAETVVAAEHAAPALDDTAVAPTQAPETVLSLREVTWRDARGVVRVQRANMSVYRGEIVGVAAVEGAGQHELLRLLSGRLTPEQGTVVRPADVGFVPEDRHRDALLLDAPLFENVALRGAGLRGGRLDWAYFRRAADELISRFDVRATGAAAPARALSGGNQQKFVLGRELSGEPPALVVENPSRGLDFKATLAVQQALRAARDRGTAVVMYSSDLDEVLMLADRVYAMHAGLVNEVIPDRDAVGRAMLGTLADDAPESLGDTDRTPAGSSA